VEHLQRFALLDCVTIPNLQRDRAVPANLDLPSDSVCPENSAAVQPIVDRSGLRPVRHVNPTDQDRNFRRQPRENTAPFPHICDAPASADVVDREGVNKLGQSLKRPVKRSILSTGQRSKLDGDNRARLVDLK
jgi:hypothetical protein